LQHLLIETALEEVEVSVDAIFRKGFVLAEGFLPFILLVILFFPESIGRHLYLAVIL